MKNILRIAPYIIGFVLVLTIVVLASVLNAKVNELKDKEVAISTLDERNRQLSELNGISVEVTFEVKNTNVLSFNNTNCQSIAREICQMTRGELLDSLNNVQNRKQ